MVDFTQATFASEIELNTAGNTTIQSLQSASNTTETPNDKTINHLDQPTEIIKSHTTGNYTPSTALQAQPEYRINPKKWCGLFRGYVRQDWETINVEDGIDELRAHWVELFFDLIYVACIVHLSAEAAYSISSDSHRRRLASSGDCTNSWKYSFIFTGFAQFGLLTNAWRNQIMYVTHFVFNQWIDDLLRLLYMICILAMGIFIQDNEAYFRAFLIAYQWLHAVNILMFLKVLLIPRGKWHAIWKISQSLLIIFCIFPIVSAMRGKCAIHYFMVYMALFLFENISWYVSYYISFRCRCKPRVQIPLNVPHVSERFGLFIMIILGESIISVMSTNLGELNIEEEFVWKDDGTPPSQILIGFVLMTFVLSYIIARLYFDCQPNEESIMNGNNNHALRISASRAKMYLQSHQILFFGLLGLGMGIKISGKHLFETKRRWIDVVLPGYSLVVIIIALNIIRIAHPYNNAKKKVWLFRIILLLIMFIMPMFAKTMNNGVIFIVIFFCIFLQLIVDVEGKEQVKIAKEEMKEKRHLADQQHNKDSIYKNMKRMRSGVGKI